MRLLCVQGEGPRPGDSQSRDSLDHDWTQCDECPSEGGVLGDDVCSALSLALDDFAGREGGRAGREGKPANTYTSHDIPINTYTYPTDGFTIWFAHNCKMYSCLVVVKLLSAAGRCRDPCQVKQGHVYRTVSPSVRTDRGSCSGGSSGRSSLHFACFVLRPKSSQYCLSSSVPLPLTSFSPMSQS